MIEPIGDEVTVDPILARIEAMERENRRMKWALAIGFIAMVLVVTRGSGLLKKTGKLIEAEGFVLVDASGHPRGKLGFTMDGRPELSLNDADGGELVALEAQHENSATLSFFNNNQTRLLLSTSDDGAASMRMLGGSGGTQASLFLWPDNTTGLALNQSTMGIVLGVQADGHTGIAVHDKDGIESGRLGSLPPNVQALGLTKLDGKRPFRVAPTATTAGDGQPEKLNSFATGEVPEEALTEPTTTCGPSMTLGPLCQPAEKPANAPGSIEEPVPSNTRS